VTARSVGSSLAEMVGRGLMLDVLTQQADQPDHWVLVPVLMRRLQLVDAAAVAHALDAVVVKGWLELDTTFHGVRRVRLTADGRALLGPARGRMHPQEQPRGKGRRVTRRRLPTRHF
jgi:hypothetical protein